ncbi:uncharacterized protein (DUF2147 family) [Sphingorhabdus rigui]|jgi:uncharacterized protein (DUF2147 family)|uniref:Uncharacterized protein (DUF2147 family) n=1 Tax=Sphingorhabdus rigui TaxID=1282858 RepID=A0A840B3M5_9SPHN|nr:DUF2147 domain-containing protein [Sphingorhabdus rigui]MBB3943154.1 uncharacterized protein (DUF2147 family) [Sphingorhabdus rigui]
MTDVKKWMTAAGLLMLPLSAQAASPITGRWVTQSKDGVVEVYPCGEHICGKLSKFLVNPPAGPGAKDINNPDKALRSRTILGMNVLTGFKAAGDEWKGQIYDPKSGKTYRSIVYKGKSGNLVVKGCIGPFCQAQTWTPAR